MRLKVSPYKHSDLKPLRGANEVTSLTQNCIKYSETILFKVCKTRWIAGLCRTISTYITDHNENCRPDLTNIVNVQLYTGPKAAATELSSQKRKSKIHLEITQLQHTAKEQAHFAVRIQNYSSNRSEFGDSTQNANFVSKSWNGKRTKNEQKTVQSN